MLNETFLYRLIQALLLIAAVHILIPDVTYIQSTVACIFIALAIQFRRD